MNKGFIFRNGTIDYTVLDYAETRFGNIALLRRDCSCCPYVVARTIIIEPNGLYTWAQGHYFTTVSCAIDYFYTRKNELQYNC